MAGPGPTACIPPGPQIRGRMHPQFDKSAIFALVHPGMGVRGKKSNVESMMAKKGKGGRLRQWYDGMVSFVRHEIWSVEQEALSQGRYRLVVALRIALLTVRGLSEKGVRLRATALTFYSLMSLVPVIALLFGIAKGFGLEGMLQNIMREKLAPYPEVSTQLIAFSGSLLGRTGGGLMAGVGVAALFWSVVKVLSNIERSFNAIWQIDRPRTWARKFSDYLSLTLIAPVVLILSSSANLYLRSMLNARANDAELLYVAKTGMLYAMRVLPYVLVPLLFALLYMLMPNTKVRFGSALVAGAVAGVGFVLLQWGYLYFQFGMSRYNAIYGSFAAFPLFLIWMQLSWMIVLVGAEISFAVQNVSLYEYEREIRNLSSRRTKELSLLLLHTIVRRFSQGEAPLTSQELAEHHRLPVRLTNRLLRWMVGTGLVSQVQGEEEKTLAYQPGVSVERLSIATVLEAYETYGETIAATGDSLQAIERLYEEHVAVKMGMRVGEIGEG